MPPALPQTKNPPRIATASINPDTPTSGTPAATARRAPTIELAARLNPNSWPRDSMPWRWAA
ncbi:MAG: hypothetical protein OXN97_14800 [Bryobacterales bacterium]|nr:hypothetical protein [Bryobacterales bacterium]